MPLTLLSTVFTDGGEIPAEYPCDPDPKAPHMTWVHWVVYNIPPTTTGFPAAAHATNLPPGTGEGLNDWKRTRYGGPCPPMGRHRYFHKLYALGTRLERVAKPTKHAVETAMRGHIIAETALIGTYKKSK